MSGAAEPDLSMVPPDLWSALPLPALLIGPGDTIAASNPAAQEALNLSARALLGQNIWQALGPETDLSAPWRRLRQGGAPLRVGELALASGAQLRAGLHAVRYGADQVLMTLTPQLDAAQSAAPQGRAARSAIGMAEMLAHEIKNPLAGIKGAAQLLAMEASAADRELTDLIIAESARIVSLLDQVEHFGDQSPPAQSAVNLHDALERARRSAQLGFGAHMRFELRFDPSLPAAHMDPDHLQQVLLNLMRNACEASPQGGTITLRTYYDPGPRIAGARQTPLQIEIADDGPGLPADIADHVFEPFVSGRPNGTGLGLALVSKLVTQNAGLLRVRSAPGHTVFTLSLPRSPQE